MLGILDMLKEGAKSSSNPLDWRYWFGALETRCIALFRILFGLLLLKDAVYHLFLSEIFYSDAGVLPRSVVFDGLARTVRFSLMDAIASKEFAFIFFLLWIFVLLALILGYRVRLMAVLNFILLLSVHERNVYVLTGADTLMRVMAFWMIFAPLAQHYSLDALRRKSQGHEPETSAFALPIRLLQWQFIIVYLCTAYLKIIGPIWTQGEVLAYVTQLDSFSLPLGKWLGTLSPEMLRFLSFGALYAEILIPFLLVFPLFWRWTRLLAFFLALGLHGGIALTLSIPDFSLLMLVCYLLFFDSAWLEWLEKRFAAQSERLTAFISPFLDWIYPQNWQVMPQRPYAPFLMAVVLVPLFALVVWWNAYQTSQYNDDANVVTNYPYPLSYPPQPFAGIIQDGENVLRFIGLWQYWDMFSPLPIQHDGWFIVQGEFENGEFIDLVSGLPIEQVTMNRWYWGPEMRWEKWEENVYAYNNEKLMASWSSYYCQLYENRAVGQRLARIELQYRRVSLHAPDAPPNEPTLETVWYHWCFPEYAPQG